MVKFSDYFNSTSIKGRANVAKATFASFAAIYVYNRLKNSKGSGDVKSKNKVEENYEDVGKQFICSRCNKTEHNHETASREANGHEQAKQSRDHKNLQKSESAAAPKSNKSQGQTAANGKDEVKSSKSKAYNGGTHGVKRKNADSPSPDNNSSH